jgi:hypothetical protein
MDVVKDLAVKRGGFLKKGISHSLYCFDRENTRWYFSAHDGWIVTGSFFLP